MFVVIIVDTIGEEETLSDKPSSYKLVCILESIKLQGEPANAETSVQCRVSLVPPPERAADKDAMEGVCHTSQAMIVQREVMSPMQFKAQVTPIKYLDGSLKVEICEKTTFGSSSNNSLGVLELPVAMISLKDRTNYNDLECCQGDNKCLLNMSVELITS